MIIGVQSPLGSIPATNHQQLIIYWGPIWLIVLIRRDGITYPTTSISGRLNTIIIGGLHWAINPKNIEYTILEELVLVITSLLTSLDYFILWELELVIIGSESVCINKGKTIKLGENKKIWIENLTILTATISKVSMWVAETNQ